MVCLEGIEGSLLLRRPGALVFPFESPHLKGHTGSVNQELHPNLQSQHLGSWGRRIATSSRLD